MELSPSWHSNRPLSYSRISTKWILIFMTALTRAYHLFLTWARRIQSPMTCFVFQIFTVYFNIYIKLLVKEYEISRVKFYWDVFHYNTQVCVHKIPSVGGKQIIFMNSNQISLILLQLMISSLLLQLYFFYLFFSLNPFYICVLVPYNLMRGLFPYNFVIPFASNLLKNKLIT
jgi:hypothetical protein